MQNNKAGSRILDRGRKIQENGGGTMQGLEKAVAQTRL
jgi:hypothetical protein